MNTKSIFSGTCIVPNCLFVDEKQIEHLMNRTAGIERSGKVDNELFASVKYCPTRHGCTGVTNCDYSYGEASGR